MPSIDLLAADPDCRPALGEDICSFLESASYPALDEGRSEEETVRTVHRLVKPLRGSLTESALWLVANQLDRSHTVSQDDPSAEGSYFHGIMHRREGDYSNAKYWMRRVGQHPVHDQLAHLVADTDELPTDLQQHLKNPDELPFILVDSTAKALKSKADWIEGLQKIGWWEWQLLLKHCLPH
ncbi:MAG TPA: hypothetical protein DDW52_10005 [Planctomycetaceae bacterium]|nr:hypothetical protein [Planctomycetaceae bacterium]